VALKQFKHLKSKIMNKKLILALTAAIVTVTACKKDRSVLPNTTTHSNPTTQASRSNVPQAVFSSNPEDVVKLIQKFKQPKINETNQARLIQDETSNLAYATSILEATLNFDHDGNFNENYETSFDKMIIDIAVDANNNVNSNDVESIYQQLNTWIVNNVTDNKKLLLVDIESYVYNQNANTASIEAYAVYFNNTNKGGCGLSPSWSKYAVSPVNRDSPMPQGCNGYQDINASWPKYSPSAIKDINWFVNCASVNINECNGYGYYWFPISQHNLVGDPNPANQPAALYTSGYQAYNWSCGWGGYIYTSDMLGFKSAILAEAANNFPTTPGNWLVAIKIITDSKSTIQPQGGNPIKAIYWDNLHIEYGIKKCHTAPTP
jgi:hypothetical protein